MRLRRRPHRAPVRVLRPESDRGARSPFGGQPVGTDGPGERPRRMRRALRSRAGALGLLGYVYTSTATIATNGPGNDFAGGNGFVRGRPVGRFARETILCFPFPTSVRDPSQRSRSRISSFTSDFESRAGAFPHRKPSFFARLPHISAEHPKARSRSAYEYERLVVRASWRDRYSTA